MTQIMLASQSPRRKALLEQVGISFLVQSAQIDEVFDYTLPLPARIERLAYEKASAVRQSHRDDIVIGADTVVCFNDHILGKPHNAQEAKDMLRMLSGQTHQVISAVAILSKQKEECFHSISEVSFYELSEDEIEAYVASGEPLDKAGAYGIQGKGAIFVAKIVGDYYNIVGLPIAELIRRLEAHR